MSTVDRERYVRLTGLGAAFLMAHCLLDNGHCAFLMDREGTPKPQAPGDDCGTGIFNVNLIIELLEGTRE